MIEDMPVETASADRGRVDEVVPRLRWRSMLPLLLLMALAVYTILPELAKLNETATVVGNLAWTPLVLALVAQGMSYVGTGFTFHSIANLVNDRLGVLRASQIALAAGSVGLMAGGPIGYAPFTYHWMRGRGMSGEGAILCGWLPALFNSITLVTISVAGVVALSLSTVLSPLELFLLIVASVVLISAVSFAVWLVGHEDRLKPVIVGAQWAWAGIRRKPLNLRKTAAAVERFATAQRVLSRGRWRAPLFGAIVCAAFDFLSFYGCFAASGPMPVMRILIAGYGLPKLLGRITFVPGGIGVIEGGMVGLYVALGVNAPQAVVAVLAYRALAFWVPMLLGLPVAAVLQHAAGQRRSTPALASTR